MLIENLLLLFLIVCALLVSVTKRLLRAVIIFMAYSIAMSVVWIFLESPDLAITEAAVEVDNKEDADVIFDIDDGITPYDTEVFMAEYL